MLLAHWAVAPAELQALLPKNVTVDTLDGTAWVSVVAYRMEDVRLRGMPRALSLNFAQLNLRTYVRVNGRQGIYFFSLDAASPLAVTAGAFVTGLPYHLARMQFKHESTSIHIMSHRLPDGPDFAASYQPLGGIASPTPLDRWLTERYVFYAPQADGRLVEGAVCHGPWVLQSARASISNNGLSTAYGLSLNATPDHLQFSAGIDILFWRPIYI